MIAWIRASSWCLYIGLQLSRVGDVLFGCNDGGVRRDDNIQHSITCTYHFCRGLSVGIYLTSNSDTCQYIAHDCQANIIIVENDYQLNKILTCRHELPNLKVIINWCSDGSCKLEEDFVMDVSRNFQCERL